MTLLHQKSWCLSSCCDRNIPIGLYVYGITDLNGILDSIQAIAWKNRDYPSVVRLGGI